MQEPSPKMNKVQNRRWAEAPGKTGPAPGAIVASGFSHLLRTAESSPGSLVSPQKAGGAPGAAAPASSPCAGRLSGGEHSYPSDEPVGLSSRRKNYLTHPAAQEESGAWRRSGMNRHM